MQSKITMSTMPRLPRTDQAIGMLRGGRSARIIARSFAVHHSTFVRITERYHITGSSNDGARSARPRVLTAGQDRANRLTHLRDRFRTATQTAAETTGTHHRPVSARTIRYRLRAEGIRPYRPSVGSVLTHRHHHAWCRTRQRWTLQPLWSQVAFSDKKKFQCFKADGGETVYRGRHERYTDACVCQVDRCCRSKRYSLICNISG